MIFYLLFILNIISLLIYLIISAKHCVKNYDNKIKGKEKEEIGTKQYIFGIIYVITSIVELCYICISNAYIDSILFLAIIIFFISLILAIISIIMRLCRNKEMSNKFLIFSTLIIVISTTIYGAILGVKNMELSKKMDEYIPVGIYIINENNIKGTKVKQMLEYVIETNKAQQKKESKHMVTVDGLDGKIKIEGPQYSQGSDSLIKNQKSYSWKCEVDGEITQGLIGYFDSVKITIEE